MRTLGAAIDVRSAPEAVFDLIHDYPGRLAWDPFLKEARLLDGAACAAVGVRALCTARAGFGGFAMETVYVSFDRPRVAAVRMTRGPRMLATFAASLRQVSVGDGVTRVTYRFHCTTRPRWLRGVLDPIAGALFLREVHLRLRALKGHLERGSASEQGTPC